MANKVLELQNFLFYALDGSGKARGRRKILRGSIALTKYFPSIIEDRLEIRYLSILVSINSSVYDKCNVDTSLVSARS